MNKKILKYPDAVGDFTNAILFNDKHAASYFERGLCYEALNKYPEAVTKKAVEAALTKTKEKQFEFNKEANNPEIIVSNLNAKDTKAVRLPKNKTTGTIKGVVKDQSMIKSITVDGVAAVFSEDDNNPSFSAVVPIENKDKVTVQVTDVILIPVPKLMIL